MKKNPLVAIALLLLISCAPDTTTDSGPLTTYKAKSGSISDAANPDNPYDEVGALRNTILDGVMNSVSKGISHEELLKTVNDVAKGYNGFAAFKTADFHTMTTAELDELLQSTPTLDAVVIGLPLSIENKVQVKSFLEGLLDSDDTDFEAVYNYIVNFENHVVGSSAFSNSEKQFILTLTSLQRYSAYYRKKPKDKDWDLLITGILAETQGAGYDIASSILYSVSFEAATHL
ncbi:hypothetical protein AMR72_15390 [Flavobacterium psychrophilum]|nr:hypothetical protein AMR72_15390 [Flavobacterium psychrophilum]AOE53775.1 hypothetical protein ALW18_15380 [Flavobacterium psychrophilum]